MWAGAERAGSVDDVGFALDQRHEQGGIVGGIVFEVGVLNDDEVSRRLLNAATKRGAFAHIPGLKENANVRMVGLYLRENFARAVGGTVVDTDQFNLQG